MRYGLGKLLVTPGAVRTLGEQHVDIFELLSRHARCDWSEMDPADRRANENAVTSGGRVFSAYSLPDGERVWVVTEASRESTTVLLPTEY